MGKLTEYIDSAIDSATVVTELERVAVEGAIAERLGNYAPKRLVGSAGYSPYSPETVVFRAAGADKRGARVALAAVCKSHDGAENRNNPGRGRWRTVCVVAPKEDGLLAVCVASDRDAVQVGSSDFYVRPWETHEAEQASRGMGLGADAMASAFAALGL